MSLRSIARDLYRLQQEVDRLEKQLGTSEPEPPAGLDRQLARAKAERDRMKQILDGHLDR